MFLHDVAIGPISLEQVLLTALFGTLIAKYWQGISWTGAFYYGGMLALVEIIIEYFDHKMSFLPPAVFGLEQMGVDFVSSVFFGLGQSILDPRPFSLSILLNNTIVAFASLVLASYAHDLLNKTPFVNEADEAIHEKKKQVKHKKQKQRSLGNAAAAAGSDMAERALEVHEMSARGDITPLF